MVNRISLFSCLFCFALVANAEEIDVTTFKYAGPFEVKQPFLVDSTNVNSHKFDASSLLESSISLDALADAREIPAGALPGFEGGRAIHLVAFNIDNKAYADVTINVRGVRHYKLYVDGNGPMPSFQRLEPSSHQVVVKYMSEPDKADTISVSVDCDKDGVISLSPSSKKHAYNLMDVLCCTRVNGVSLSPDGKWMITKYQNTDHTGKTTSRATLTELASGRVTRLHSSSVYWMPTSNKYYYTNTGIDGYSLVVVDPQTNEQNTLVEKMPEGQFAISPTEDFMIVTKTENGPKEDANVYQVLEPEDRQQGWRTRSNLYRFDFRSGLLQPLTFGHHNVMLQDISADGKWMLFMKTESRLTARPTTVNSLYKMNLQTLEVEEIVSKDGFIGSAVFSPDASKILLTGTPESLGGIGRNVRPDQIPSMTDNQLFLLEGGSWAALTKNFDPSVSNVEWSKADGMVYFTAEDRDSVNLFQLNPKNKQIREIACSEEMVMRFSASKEGSVIAYYGQGASNSDRVYTLNLKNFKSTLRDDVSAQTLKNVTLGQCRAWTFTNSRGDTIYGRYYLPADFDASKQYPMIVNYYGGCSPTSRNFESRYPQHAYASLGYVVLVINPSGATGFGQEFSARHVNTAGQGVAEDIIEGTKQFCKEHSFVNDKKIGCIGASYGGFMTQYLQTVTDIFAAAISHAGISDHTSYWGEGYWGYSYSEVSMAGSYPWTDKHLYVDQSPLFNADKIHTPLLFLHGDADTNVPVGESIQMYTALKLLGRETSMVLVKGENHHILDFQKRIKWQNTIFAWFAKYLQDDSSWWNSLYPEKDL